MLTNLGSTYIMWKSLAHNDAFGPMASAYRDQKGEEAAIDSPNTASTAERNGVVTVPAVSPRIEPYPGT